MSLTRKMFVGASAFVTIYAMLAVSVAWAQDRVALYAVYAVKQDTGEPTRIQNIDTRGGEPRTFWLDASGRILVAANQVPMTVRDGAKTTTLPASLAVFRVRDDGKLDFVRKVDVEAGGNKSLYWMGIVSLP